MAKPLLTTLGESLHWSYANLAMAHAAVTDGASSYGTVHYMIRQKLYSGLKSGRMSLGSSFDDERVKARFCSGCSYCGAISGISIDHLLPKALFRAEFADNYVWACRGCNSSKGKRDIVTWFAAQGEFPPLLLVRKHLKILIAIAQRDSLMEERLDQIPAESFLVCAIPRRYPKPSELCLWIAHPDAPLLAELA